MIKRILNMFKGRQLVLPAIAFMVGATFIAWAQQTNYLGTVFIADSVTPSQQMRISSGGGMATGGSVNTTAPTYTNGQFGEVQLTTRGELIVRPSAAGAVISAGNPGDNLANGIQVFQENALLSVFDGTTWDRLRGTAEAGVWVQGSVASAATDSGNPVKIGGLFSTTAATVTSGQRSDIAVGSTGSVRVQLCNVNDGGSTNCVNLGSDNVDGASSTSAAQRPIMASRGWKYNGSTWDRDFACTSQASATVTAGATTEIVALTASQVIRVCAFTIGISASGTVKFVQGTGTNCGTGTADIMPATQLTSGEVIAMGDGTAAVLRTASANALCVTAATGNAQVFVSYAKY